MKAKHPKYKNTIANKFVFDVKVSNNGKIETN